MVHLFRLARIGWHAAKTWLAGTGNEIWNGPTDPDSVWHAQRERANRTLMQHGLPALDGRKPLPDSVLLSRFPEAESGQK
ncbi:MAG TPA: hypothetical protein PLB55_09125 [Prosthecobacter sp.]|jgi:hypothetical protein|nr:hypothetical protein [Prosthecobacter sp.]